MSREMQDSPGGLRDAIYKLWRKFRNAFSTSAMRTGQVWTNGTSEIKRIVVACGALPNATSKSVAHGITGLGTVVRCYGMADNGTVQRPLPYADATATEVVELEITDTNVVLRSTGDQSGFTSSHVVIEYT